MDIPEKETEQCPVVIEANPVAIQQTGLPALSPEEILEHGQRAAKALMKVVNSKPANKKLVLNGEQYIDNGDWQLLAKFSGVSAKIVKTEYIEYGEDVKGFLARAVVIDKNGVEISGGEMTCTSDEQNWNTEDVEKEFSRRDGGKYTKFFKGKPLFQLRSMAQTRAISKALRSVLGWIPVLAGYSSTPAEEIVYEQKELEYKKPEHKEPPKETSSGGYTLDDFRRKIATSIMSMCAGDLDRCKTKLLEIAEIDDTKKIKSIGQAQVIYGKAKAAYTKWEKNNTESMKSAIGVDDDEVS